MLQGSLFVKRFIVHFMKKCINTSGRVTITRQHEQIIPSRISPQPQHKLGHSNISSHIKYPKSQINAQAQVLKSTNSYLHLYTKPIRPQINMPQTWTPTDIISLIKFINHIWRRIEKTEETLDEPHPLEVLETKLQHLSEALEYLRRETEHEKSILLTNSERKREVGHLLGQLSVDLNVLDIMVGRMKNGLVGVDKDNFDGVGERLETRLKEMNALLEKVKRAENGGLNWALHGIANGWHHVHWADLVEVRYPKDEFYQSTLR